MAGAQPSALQFLCIYWHFIYNSWSLKIVPSATQNTGDTSKNGAQLCAVLELVVLEIHIVGSNKIRIHTATSDNEPEPAVAMDMFTNYVGSERCVVYTIVLSVNDLFKPGTARQNTHEFDQPSYFNQHPKLLIRQLAKQKESGITNERLELPKLWHQQ